MDHTCDESVNNVLNIEEEAVVTSIYSINITNNISMNYYYNYMHKYYAPFLSSNNHLYVSSGSEYNSDKRRVCCNKKVPLDSIINESNSF